MISMVFSVKNKQDLIEKITLLLENEEKREKMGENSKNMVKKFDWENVVNKILDEYQNMGSRS